MAGKTAALEILIADDEPTSLKILERTLTQLWGYRVRLAQNGKQAFEMLQAPDAPRIALLDWVMPEMEGVEVVKRVRALPQGDRFYLAILTVKEGKEDRLAGLRAGADDFITKPFDSTELQLRLQTAQRIVRLHQALQEKEKALADLQHQMRRQDWKKPNE